MHTAIRLLLIVNVAASFLPTPTTLLPHASPLRTAAITAIEKKETAIDVADAQTLLASFLAEGGSVVDGEIVDDDDDNIESDEEALERALIEESALSNAPPLQQTPLVDAASTLRADGVVRLANALSAETASALRAHVLSELEKHRGGEASIRSGAADERFSAVLAPHAATDEDDPTEERRWDLRLRLTPLVRYALRELIGGPLGDVMEKAAGDDSTLYECAALVSSPGAPPQPLHADTLWTDGNGCLYTSFVALQEVTRAMGPTRFLLGSHTEEAHDQFEEMGRDEPEAFVNEYLEEERGACGLVETGEATLYDGRLLHGGGANEEGLPGFLRAKGLEGTTRVLFYVTFARADAVAELDELSNYRAYSLLEGYRGKFTLGQLREMAEEDEAPIEYPEM